MTSLALLVVTSLFQGTPVVFNNTAPTGLVLDLTPGHVVFDEGRIPSTSAPEGGTQDTYSITEVELGYGTSSLDTAQGGPGARILLSFYFAGDASLPPDELGQPQAVYDITGLPASTVLGTQTTHVVNYVLPTPVCFRADGDGAFDMNDGNDFVWSLSMPDEIHGPGGPLVAGDPQLCAPGDGTYFQAVGACGTGLSSVDGYGELDLMGNFQYRDFGGYPQNPFGSFYLVAKAPLNGECSGCGIGDPYFEDNDTCATALAMPLGKSFGLIAEDGDEDYYSVSIPPSSDLLFRVDYDVNLGDLDVEVYEAGCGVLIGTADPTSTGKTLSLFDCGGTARDLVLRVASTPGSCLEYDLTLDAMPVIDDSFEDNDVCSQSALAGLSTFTTTDLVVSECDSDYFRLRVSDQREVRIDLFFEHTSSNVDVFLFAADCQTLLQSSTSLDNSESVTVFNGTGGPVDIVAEIVCSGGLGHAEYSLSACYSLGDLISFQTCASEPNSTGRPATMCARGSDVVADNFVLFYAVDLPPNAFGYFITAQGADNVPHPAGIAGTLCLDSSGGIGRYFDDVLQTNSQSAVFFQPDLTQTPFPDGVVPVVAGETRYWQFWYRDSLPGGGTTSNLTSGTGITFQ